MGPSHSATVTSVHLSSDKSAFLLHSVCCPLSLNRPASMRSVQEKPPLKDISDSSKENRAKCDSPAQNALRTESSPSLIPILGTKVPSYSEPIFAISLILNNHWFERCRIRDPFLGTLLATRAGPVAGSLPAKQGSLFFFLQKGARSVGCSQMDPYVGMRGPAVLRADFCQIIEGCLKTPALTTP